MKIVLDTNVIVAAYATRGLAYSVFRLCLQKYKLIISSIILEELESNFTKKLNMPPDEASMNLSFLRRTCGIGEITAVDPSRCRDRNDVHILGLAENTKADMIITGDNDLLEIHSYKGISILSPRQFWEMERKTGSSASRQKEIEKSKKIHDRQPEKYRTASKKAPRK
ncbi:MAG: putative toxin-antitoxin system toxin component, PIN family [Candidatus Aminicenantes bacterium]|nr:putative toxin-antitoxin system toxin component, PIN family [Candidatus Aminicenantes bacterium]